MIQRLQSYIVLLYISFTLQKSKECSGRLQVLVDLVLIHCKSYQVVILKKNFQYSEDVGLLQWRQF